MISPTHKPRRSPLRLRTRTVKTAKINVPNKRPAALKPKDSVITDGVGQVPAEDRSGDRAPEHRRLVERDGSWSLFVRRQLQQEIEVGEIVTGPEKAAEQVNNAHVPRCRDEQPGEGQSRSDRISRP